MAIKTGYAILDSGKRIPIKVGHAYSKISAKLLGLQLEPHKHDLDYIHVVDYNNINMVFEKDHTKVLSITGGVDNPFIIDKLEIPIEVESLEIHNWVWISTPITLPDSIKIARMPSHVSLTNIDDFTNKSDVRIVFRR